MITFDTNLITFDTNVVTWDGYIPLPRPFSPVEITSTFRDYNWRDLLSRIDPDLDKPQNAYEFGNGRTFQDPGAQGGAYKQP